MRPYSSVVVCARTRGMFAASFQHKRRCRTNGSSSIRFGADVRTGRANPSRALEQGHDCDGAANNRSRVCNNGGFKSARTPAQFKLHLAERLPEDS